MLKAQTELCEDRQAHYVKGSCFMFPLVQRREPGLRESQRRWPWASFLTSLLKCPSDPTGHDTCKGRGQSRRRIGFLLVVEAMALSI